MSTTSIGPPPGPAVAGGPPPATAVVPQREVAGRALLICATSLGAGILLGVLWWVLAPSVPCTVLDGGDCRYSYEGGRFFIAEGMFSALLVAYGVIVAVAVRRWVRRLGWPIAVALAVGGLLASVVAWRVGVWLGPDDPNGTGLVVGAAAELPLRLRATGLLLASSIASLVVALWTTMASIDPVEGAL